MEEAEIKKQIEDAKLAFEQSKNPENSKNSGLGWETDEHAKLGPKVDIYMRPQGYSMTYGEIVALAGDWFETPEDLINASKEKIDAILGGEGVDDRPYNKELYNEAFGEMATIALTNTSHFSPQNIETWKKFKAQAEDYAMKAFHSHTITLTKDVVNDYLKGGDLEIRNAFLYNAFADHFLSDSFSAGHIRTPAKVMRENPERIEVGRESKILNGALFIAQHFPKGTTTQVFLIYAGVLIKEMHDEDGKNGLNVQSSNGKKWRAYGDGRLETSENKENYDLVKKAVDNSAESIYYILQTGRKTPTIIADIESSVPYASNDNSPPMWKVKTS
ncbi:hypothetical protein [uncultured Kordia sp.]|uniref:hypothetical protein n=1 Tax=uncultured Kordia sp. TaxID=507699 RepID=UPI00262403DC|nr:hypothetical protein [uncultured Kordia sp.]